MAALGWGGFLLLLAMVSSGWDPLLQFDAAAIEWANRTFAERGVWVTVMGIVTDAGGAAGWVVIIAATVFLLARSHPQLAGWAALTGLGGRVLELGFKEMVGRVRPVVPVQLATAPGPSFPSGHALTAVVAFGVLVLLFLPAVPPRYRGVMWGGAGLVVVLVGFTRVGLGVHFPSDVLAGFLLGSAWIGVTTTAFGAWRRLHHLPRTIFAEGLAPETKASLLLAPDSGPDELPHPWRATALLVALAVGVFGLVGGLGWLVTNLVDGFVAAELSLVEALVELRGPALNQIVRLFSSLGGTPMLLGLGLVIGSLILALSRRWLPLLYLAVTMGGEVLLFLGVSRAVGRPRPQTDPLVATLPPTSSFPSGHMAAAICFYGAVAVLVCGRWPGWPCRAAGALAVLIPLGVGFSRLYLGVHFPTDVLGGILLGVLWLTATTVVLVPRFRRDGG